MKRVLDPLQVVGAKNLASNFHHLLADEPGCGKTDQVAEACEMVNAQTILVTCPASVRLHWHEIMEERRGHTRGLDVISYEGGSNQKVRSSLRSHYDVWAGDEIHFCQACDSLRTQAIFGPGGLARLASYRWPLTGTPVYDRIRGLYPMLAALHPHFRGMSYAAFTQRYCAAFFDGRGINTKGASHVDELAALLSPFMTQRTLKDFFPDRVEPVVTRVPVELSIKDLMAVTAEEDIIGGREARLSSSYDKFSQLGDTSKLLRLLGEAMVPHVAAFTRDLLVTVDKAVVFAHHTDVIGRLYYKFRDWGLNPVVYQGGMSDAQKEEAKVAFREPGRYVFIAQDQAAGTGVDGLQETCHTAVIAEPRWTPGGFQQTVRRLDRRGQAHLVNAYAMYARGTLSAVAMAVQDSKSTVIRRLDSVAASLRVAAPSITSYLEEL